MAMVSAGGFTRSGGGRGEARVEGRGAWASPPGSDLDVLVEFEPGQTPGLELFDIQAELSQLLGRRMDLSRRSSVRVSALTNRPSVVL